MTGEPTTLVFVPGPAPAPDPWMHVAIASAVLVAACLVAYWRARQPDRAPPRRIARILWASLACSLGLTLILAPDEIIGSGLWDPWLGPALLAGLAAWTILAFLLFGSADLMLDFFHPHRALAWLLIAPLALTAYGIGFLTASGWLDGFDTGSAGAVPLVAVLAAGLIWWSYLPVHPQREPNRTVAGIFE